MSTYTPDCWVIVKIIQDSTVIYKILAGWYGGYLGADSWKINSGIVAVTEENGLLLFHGETGSIYKCHPGCERMSTYVHSIFSHLKGQETESLKIDTVEYSEFKEAFNAKVI